MTNQHQFVASLEWYRPQNIIEATAKRTTKNHQITINGKAPLTVSAAKTFKGDASQYNPEDLLLSSVMSCHMMSFLYVCSKYGVEVLTYTDEGHASLEVAYNGSGRITAIHLYPKVSLGSSLSPNDLNNLHQQAHEMCFIANSCNFPIHIHVD